MYECKLHRILHNGKLRIALPTYYTEMSQRSGTLMVVTVYYQIQVPTVSKHAASTTTKKVTTITYEEIQLYAQLCTVFRLFFLPDLEWELGVTCTKAQITVNRRLCKKSLARSQNVARCPLARVLFSGCLTNATYRLDTRTHHFHSTY